MTKMLLTDVDDRGVARVTLNRADVHNAFNEELIAALTQTFQTLGEDAGVRVIVLRGAGPSFSAGADVNWMRQAAGYGEEQNVADAMHLSTMLHTLNTVPKPTIALVHGAAMGGGVGLVACCDIALAVRSAKFALSEVRLGLTPATISPYVIAKIGEGQARRLFLTAERFDGVTAEKIGLLHITVGSVEDLDVTAEGLIDQLLVGAPGAQAAAKDLIFTVKGREVTLPLREETAERIAVRRASPEGREGLAAFLDKRRPAWVAGSD